MPFPSTTILPSPVVPTARSVPAAVPVEVPAEVEVEGAVEGAVEAVEQPARTRVNTAAPVRLRVSFVFTRRSFDKGASADAELGTTYI